MLDSISVMLGMELVHTWHKRHWQSEVRRYCSCPRCYGSIKKISIHLSELGQNELRQRLCFLSLWLVTSTRKYWLLFCNTLFSIVERLRYQLHLYFGSVCEILKENRRSFVCILPREFSSKGETSRFPFKWKLIAILSGFLWFLFIFCFSGSFRKLITHLIIEILHFLCLLIVFLFLARSCS